MTPPNTNLVHLCLLASLTARQDASPKGSTQLSHLFLPTGHAVPCLLCHQGRCRADDSVASTHSSLFPITYCTLCRALNLDQIQAARILPYLTAISIQTLRCLCAPAPVSYEAALTVDGMLWPAGMTAMRPLLMCPSTPS